MELLVRKMMEAAENGDFKALKFVLEHGLLPSNRNGGQAGSRGRQGDAKESKGASPATDEDFSVTAEKQILSLKETEAELLKGIAHERAFLEKYPRSTMVEASKRRLQGLIIELDFIRAFIRRIAFAKEVHEYRSERRMPSRSRQGS